MEVSAALDSRNGAPVDGMSTLRDKLQPLLLWLVSLDAPIRNAYISRTSTGYGVDAVAVKLLCKKSMG